jgi:hypothetical protein
MFTGEKNPPIIINCLSRGEHLKINASLRLH